MLHFSVGMPCALCFRTAAFLVDKLTTVNSFLASGTPCRRSFTDSCTNSGNKPANVSTYCSRRYHGTALEAASALGYINSSTMGSFGSD